MALWLIAGAGLLAYLAITVHLCLLALGYRYQLDYGEGLVLYQARLLAQGQSIYKAIDSYPYIFSNYPPLFQALTSPLVAILGPSFLAGRLLAVAATLGLGTLLYTMARRAGSGKLAAACAGLLFLGSPYIYHWAPLFRIDLPALLLSALGVFVLWSATSPDVAFYASRRLETSHSTSSTSIKTMGGAGRSAVGRAEPRIWLAGLLFVLSLYTKQSYVAAPAAACIYLLLNDRRALGQLVLALAVFGLAPFIALDLATGGAFSFGLFTANVNPFSLSLLLSQVRDFAATFAVVIILAVIGALSARQAALPARSRLSFLHWYLLAALATILFAGKAGAWENYFFEALFALCLFAGAGVGSLLRSTNIAMQALIPLALIIQLALMWHDPRIGVRLVSEDGAANRALAPLIARQQGMILSENLGLLLVNGQDVPYFSFEYAQLARVGRWDQRWETENLRAGYFALVVLEKGTREDPDHYQRFTRQVLSAVDAAYGLIAEVGKYRIYSPRSMLRTLDVDFGGQIALLGYRLDAPPAPGSDVIVPPPTAALPALDPYPAALRLTLLWQARAGMTTDYKVFVHLEDAAGVRRAQADAQPLSGLYPTSRWASGETVRDYLDIALPAGLAAERYVLRVGLYDAATGQRLAVSDGSTSYPLAALTMGQVVTSAQEATPAATAFAGGVTLGGYDALPARLAAGSALTLTLHWRTDTYLDQDYTVFVHLARDDARPLAQADSPPQSGQYPTSLWNLGEDIADTHVLAIPSGLQAGSYRLLVGLYDPRTQTRMPLLSGGDSADLGRIEIGQ